MCIPYSAKFSRRIIFAVLEDWSKSAKIKLAKFFQCILGRRLLPRPSGRPENKANCKVHTRSHFYSKLPDAWGPLAKEVPSTSIASANEAVRRMVQQPTAKRGPYTKFTCEQKAEIGKRAAEHGVAATIRY